MQGYATGRVFYKTLSCWYALPPDGAVSPFPVPLEILHHILFQLGDDLASLMAMSKVNRYSRYLVKDFLSACFNSLANIIKLKKYEGSVISYMVFHSEFMKSMTRVQLLSFCFHLSPSLVMDKKLADIVRQTAPESPKAAPLRDFFRMGMVSDSSLSAYVKYCLKFQRFEHVSGLLKALPPEKRFEYLYGMAMHCRVLKLESMAAELLLEMIRVGSTCSQEDSQMTLTVECVNFALRIGPNHVDLAEVLPCCIAPLSTLLSSRLTACMQLSIDDLPGDSEALKGLESAFQCVFEASKQIGMLSNVGVLFDQLETMLMVVKDRWSSQVDDSRLLLHFRTLVGVLCTYIMAVEEDPRERLGAIAKALGDKLRNEVFYRIAMGYLALGKMSNAAYLRPFVQDRHLSLQLEAHLDQHRIGR